MLPLWLYHKWVSIWILVKKQNLLSMLLSNTVKTPTLKSDMLCVIALARQLMICNLNSNNNSILQSCQCYRDYQMIQCLELLVTLLLLLLILQKECHWKTSNYISNHFLVNYVPNQSIVHRIFPLLKRTVLLLQLPVLKLLVKSSLNFIKK